MDKNGTGPPERERPGFHVDCDLDGAAEIAPVSGPRRHRTDVRDSLRLSFDLARQLPPPPDLPVPR